MIGVKIHWWHSALALLSVLVRFCMGVRKLEWSSHIVEFCTLRVTSDEQHFIELFFLDVWMHEQYIFLVVLIPWIRIWNWTASLSIDGQIVATRHYFQVSLCIWEVRWMKWTSQVRSSTRPVSFRSTVISFQYHNLRIVLGVEITSFRWKLRVDEWAWFT